MVDHGDLNSSTHWEQQQQCFKHYSHNYYDPHCFLQVCHFTRRHVIPLFWFPDPSLSCPHAFFDLAPPATPCTRDLQWVLLVQTPLDCRSLPSCLLCHVMFACSCCSDSRMFTDFASKEAPSQLLKDQLHSDSLSPKVTQSWHINWRILSKNTVYWLKHKPAAWDPPQNCRKL